MRLFDRRFGIACAGLAACLVHGGCSPEDVKVTGTVVRDGKPVPVGSIGLEVTLVPDVAEGEHFTTYVGRCDPDGKFEIVGVKPGKYKVAVTHPEGGPGSDKLNGAFASDKTPIRREVDGKKPLEIDLAKP